jgi:hypothetical protein
MHAPSIDPALLWAALIQALNGKQPPNFEALYNNDPHFKRHRNLRPRTDVMLRRSDSVLKSVLGRLKKDGHLPSDGQISAERYIDMSYSTGYWWTGNKQRLLAVEVENSWAELRGTLRDLLQFQAKTKMAVFYATPPEDREGELLEAAICVAKSFATDGFVEAAGTPYLVVIAPDSCSSSPASCLGIGFTGLESVSRAQRFSATLWAMGVTGGAACET